MFCASVTAAARCDASSEPPCERGAKMAAGVSWLQKFNRVSMILVNVMLEKKYAGNTRAKANWLDHNICWPVKDQVYVFPCVTYQHFSPLGCFSSAGYESDGENACGQFGWKLVNPRVGDDANQVNLALQPEVKLKCCDQGLQVWV